MTKDEYICLRIAELQVRRDYAAKLVMNRDMAHEVKMCDKQIEILVEIMKDKPEPITENSLLKIGPLVQVWVQGSNPQQLMHTNDHGIDTVLCENHLTDVAGPCSNCIQPYPITYPVHI